MLTIGLSGATCSGKTSVASMLERVLTSCVVINQDAYYHQEESDKHVRDPVTNMINWEVMEAFNMEQMHQDIISARQKLRAKSNPEVGQINTTGILNSLLGQHHINKTLLNEIEKLKNTPIMIVEGIIVLNDPEIFKLCDLKFFIKIEREICWNRRKSRVWDPEGSCWEESPGYFEDIAWPGYVKCLAELEETGLDGIKFLDSNQTTIQENFTTVISEIVEKFKLSS
eukprot:GFUD01013958.1.p1 GENE.GFUD01013958.1~~GFUD01013958.1.p1  ORF type:complete len:227 (-),score=73.14 GFUD01013958.1:2-682(-)